MQLWQQALFTVLGALFGAGGFWTFMNRRNDELAAMRKELREDIQKLENKITIQEQALIAANNRIHELDKSLAIETQMNEQILRRALDGLASSDAEVRRRVELDVRERLGQSI